MKKRATIYYLILAAFIASVSLMAGCGGSLGAPSTTPPGGGAATIVTGTASKGIIYPGTVKLYGVDPVTNSKGAAPLKTVSTKPDGTYTADLGGYSGALIIEVSGTYTDEATKKPVTIDPALPLHAVVDLVDGSANNNRPIAVTPLTELAFKKVGSDFSATKISAANKLVSELFKVSDIIAVQPVEANRAVLSGANIEQQSYALALASLSQMMETSTGDGLASFSEIEALLDSLVADMNGSSDSTLSTAHMTAFTAALGTVTSPASELSDFSTAVANLSAVGTKTLSLTLSVGTIPSGVQLGTLKVTLALPAGVSVRADAAGAALGKMISGADSAGTSAIFGYYQPVPNTLAVSLLSATGFGTGDVMNITLDVKSGTTVSASNITATINEAKDGSTYGAVSGVTVSVR